MRTRSRSRSRGRDDDDGDGDARRAGAPRATRGDAARGEATTNRARRRRSSDGANADGDDGATLERGEIAPDANDADARARATATAPSASRGTAARGTRTGGAYVPPFKLAQMMRETNDKTSVEYQRMSWDALKKSINGLVNKVNASNVQHVVPELFQENLIRGRGLFARSVMKSQMASPQFSGVFAALVAVVNTKFPEIGELIAKRCVLQFRRAYKRNDKPVCVAATRFLAALINQQVRCSMDDAMRRGARDVTEDEL